MNRPARDGRLLRLIEREYRISLCITCMGRLSDLTRTLPVNLELNAAYPQLEFVLLDYNSNDGVGDWIQREMRSYIKTGRLVYFRTEEPQFYSMSHSRNLAFKLASGEIVNNLDADNYTLDLALSESDRPSECFAAYLNRLANQQPERALFAKSRRLMRGRLGFFRSEFIDQLGGYDEQLQGYGHDDHDLRDRAWHLGFRSFFFGGQYYSRLKTSGRQKVENMEAKNWRLTEKQNKRLSAANISKAVFRANVGREWGKGRVRKNFSEWLEV